MILFRDRFFGTAARIAMAGTLCFGSFAGAMAGELDDLAVVVDKLISGKTFLGDNGTKQVFDKLTKVGDAYVFNKIVVTTTAGVTIEARDKIFQDQYGDLFLEEYAENETIKYGIFKFEDGTGFRVEDISGADYGFLRRDCAPEGSKTVCKVTSMDVPGGFNSVIRFEEVTTP